MFTRLFIFLFTVSLSFAQLETLRKGHPRLLVLDSDLERTRALIKDNAQARQMHERLVATAEAIEKLDPIEHVLIGPRLLDKSRTCVDRIYTLALLYRLDKKPQYLNRALKELRAAAAFKDWNPSHFLDVAEMTHAFAIGYDWLYNDMKPEDRALIKKAIIELGLNQSLPIYKEQRWWSVVSHNWNQVCNGGMGLGALAIADEEPELSAKILNYALKSIPRAMASYGPDGGWNEGPGYWAYATRYTVYFLAGLDTALGKDFGLSSIEGFSRAGHFRVYSSGTAGKTFNYADAGNSIEETPGMFWLAKRFKEPVYAWHQQQLIANSRRLQALNLAWYSTDAVSPKAAGWPSDKMIFKGVDVAFLRSSWEDKNATYLAIKGGDNKANHSHLDLGTFVLDSQGVRWATDLGGDNYNLPAYFGPKRWDYYRLRTESHNTVLIDGENQDTKAKAPMDSGGVIDLTAAYAAKLKSFKRSAVLTSQGAAITDTISAKQPVEALWGMVTEAEVVLHGKTAELRKNGKTLKATIDSPANGVFEIVSTTPPEPQNQNAGTRKLVVRLPEKVKDVTLRVSFENLR